MIKQLPMQSNHLCAQDSFEIWAENRLSLYNDSRLLYLLEPAVFNISEGFSAASLQQLLVNIRDFNLAFYSVEPGQKLTSVEIALMSNQLGLKTLDKNHCASEDCISLISDSHAGKRYVPYTNRALGWHTDGYYNPFHQRVMAFILHCQVPAAQGGINSFIDPEIVYLLLRRENPAFIEALCHPQAMCIPANNEGETCIRGETSSSVFQLNDSGCFEGMRYSQRKRHISWRDDPVTLEALSCLNNILNNANKWRIECRLEAGQGVIANNVLHRRESYIDSDEQKRLYIRARYYNSVQYDRASGVS